MRMTLTAVLTGINNPSRAKLTGNTQATARQSLNGMQRILKAIYAGSLRTRVMNRPTTTFSLATATVPLGLTTGVANGTTITVNGVVLTATQSRASATVTFATCAEADTIVVNGVTFTAVTAITATNQFLMTGTDTQDAAAFAAAVVASTTSGIASPTVGAANIISAKSLTAIATVFASAIGTAGNAYTITSSNGTRLAVSGSVLSGGLTSLGDNTFDFVGTPAVNAGDVINQLAASTSALVSSQVVGSQRSAIVTCVSVLAAQTVNINGAILVGSKQSTLSGSAQIAAMDPDLFEVSGSDTNTGNALAACINSHPILAEKYWALNAAGAVTIIERAPIHVAQAPTISTSNGTSLAVTTATGGFFTNNGTVLVQASEGGVAGNAITIATSSSALISLNGQARLTGGTSTTTTW